MCPAAGLYVIPRDMAIDKLRLGIVVTQRPMTDIIDIRYWSKNPRTSAAVVNSTIQTFQRLNIQGAKEKSRRRREFLEGQLKQTDSMLARVQSELASFRSRQQLASSQSALDAQQTAMMALDARRGELEADRNTFASLMGQLRKGGAAGEAEAIRALASSPALADNPTVSNYYRQLSTYEYRLDSMTTGPWKAAPTNPDLIQLQSLIASTKAQLRQAVGSHVATLDARIGSLRGLRDRSAASLQTLPAMAEEEARLNSRVQTLTSTSDQVRQEYQKARMAEEVEAGDVEIVNLADIPYTAELGTAPVKLIVGLLVGFLLGLGGAFLIETMNTSIRRPEDLELALNVPGLAVIPPLSGSAQPARRLGGLLGSGKKARARVGALHRGGVPAVFGRPGGLQDAAHQPALVRAGRQDENPGRHQRRPRRGQDPDSGQSFGHLRLRRPARAADRLRRAPPQVARPLPGAPGPRADGAVDPSRILQRRGVAQLRSRPRSNRVRSCGHRRDPSHKSAPASRSCLAARCRPTRPIF